MKDENHICKSCGEVNKDASDLCEPLNLNSVYACEQCGCSTDNADSLCKPQKQTVNFTCISCGRVSDLPGKLCNPRDIELMQRDDPPTRIF